VKVSEIQRPIAALVTWLDAAHHQGWFDGNDELPTEPLQIESLGWLVFRDEKAVVLAMSAGEHNLGELLVVPMCCVVSVDELPPDDLPCQVER